MTILSATLFHWPNPKPLDFFSGVKLASQAPDSRLKLHRTLSRSSKRFPPVLLYAHQQHPQASTSYTAMGEAETGSVANIFLGEKKFRGQ
jgi:hypothetical protein